MKILLLTATLLFSLQGALATEEANPKKDKQPTNPKPVSVVNQVVTIERTQVQATPTIGLSINANALNRRVVQSQSTAALGGTDIGGGVSAKDILNWCDETTLEMSDLLEESAYDLLESGSYYVASQSLVSQLENLLDSNPEGQLNTKLAGTIDRVIRFHSALGGEDLDKTEVEYRFIYEFVSEYAAIIQRMAYSIDRARLTGASIESLEYMFMEYSKNQLQFIQQFNITGRSGSEVFSKDARMFLISADFIAGEISQDILNSFYAERYSCAYKKAQRVQKQFRGSLRMQQNRKYKRFNDFLINMNTCN